MVLISGGRYVNAFTAAAALVAVTLLASPALGDGRREATSRSVEEGLQHVVGDDQGWDASPDLAAWAINRVFRTGDKLWFAYSGGGGGILELASREAFESCDLSWPLRLYSAGLDKVSLDAEGSRFFASGERDRCRNGLKLHVEVMPRSADSKPAAGNWQQQATSERTTAGGYQYYQAMAAGPAPSAAHQHLAISYETAILVAIMALPIWL